MRRLDSRSSRGSVAGVALLVAAVLAACTPMATPAPSATTTDPPTPTSSATPTPTAPVLVPDGSADENLPLFASVVAGVWDPEAQVRGRDYIDALVEAGFDKDAMELTADRTTVDLPADSVQFSVRWDDEECLVGQVGPSVSSPQATVLPVLPTGSCLVGKTRAIDW